MALRPGDEPREDKRLRRMIFISAAIHAAMIVWLVVGASFGRSTPPRSVAFTVDLVNPAAVGTNLPGGGKNRSRTEPEPAPPKVLPAIAEPSRPAVAPPQPQVVKQEEPKAPVPIPVKEKPVEAPPVKPVPEKAKVEEKKPEAKKPEPKPELPKVAKIEEPKPEAKKPVAEPQPEKSEPKKVEEKKPAPPQIAVKPKKEEPKPGKPEVQPAPVSPKPPNVATEKFAQEKPEKTDTVEERDRQIAAALDRVRTQVQPPKGNEKREDAADEIKGKGPVTKGGEAGEGGGGIVRGLEFIMYTQQLQQLVQESWIVTEKNPRLVATVSFKIEPDGAVQEMELSSSSGDVAFDQSVLRAVRKAAPFPPPPVSYAEEFAAQKIVMNFGGEGRVN